MSGPHPSNQLQSTPSSQPSRDDKRKFVRTLLPLSLVPKLHSVVGLQLREALAHRRPKLAPLIRSQISLLASRHSQPLHRHPGPVDYWQSSTQQPHRPVPRYRPPTALPTSCPIQDPQPERKRKRKDSPPQGSQATVLLGPNPRPLHRAPEPFPPRNHTLDPDPPAATHVTP